MKKALKSALLSGLVFPGVGQLRLKHHLRGALLIVLVSGGLIFLVVDAVQQALVLLDKIAAEGGSMDMNSLTAAANQAASVGHPRIANAVGWLVAACWIFAVVDAYRLGRKADLEAQAEGRAGKG